jgi:exo-beta-1,3-glucanase (GH17 family)
MATKSNKHFYILCVLFSGLSLSGLLIITTDQAARVIASAPLTAGSIITLTPDEMTLTDHVATQANTVGQCTEPWLASVPTGTIILGVDPVSCDPATWSGGTATAQVFLPNVYTKTVYALKLFWPDRDGKGLHSPRRNQVAAITFDGHPIWSKRTTTLSTFGNYYAAEHQPILTTLVVTQSLTHTLAISVSAQTAWDLSQIELRSYPYPAQIQGIGYSPYRDCQVPAGVVQPSSQDMEEDLWRLFHTTNAIRTYAATGVNHQIPALANQLGLPIFAGAWLDHSDTPALDEAEIQALITLANTTTLQGVIVGNEFYLRHRTSADINYLGQRIAQVKSGLANPNLPIMTAEIDNLMFSWQSVASPVSTGIQSVYRPVLDNTSVVMVHIYPYWSGLSIEGAAAFTVQRYKAIQNLIAQTYPGQNKRVIIGETGWPSGGQTNGQAVPSLANQERYLREFLLLAEQQGVEYLFFDAIDEQWKIISEGPVGPQWGYSHTDRTAKHNFYGVLLPMQALFYPYQIYLPFLARNASSPELAPAWVDDLFASLASQSLIAGNSSPFLVYSEWPTLGSPQFVGSNFIGDTDNIQQYECDRADPHSGEMAIRASFSPTGTLGWGGVGWLYPENNLGTQPQGIDLSWANKLTFWAKGATGGEKVQFFVGGVGTQTDPYPDSVRPEVSTGYLQLQNSWQQYTLNLRGKNLTHVVRGFGWSTDHCANPTGVTFYLDDIQFEYDANLPLPPTPGPTFPIYTNAGAQSNHYVPSGWMGDGTVPGRVSLTECWLSNPHSGSTGIRINYSQAVIGWAGIYWTHPAENWGDRPGGFDLTGAKRVTFWARGDTAGDQVTFIIGGLAYPGGTNCSAPQYNYPDSICPKLEQTVTLSTAWTQYTITLPQNRDLSRVVGGFGWTATQPLTFYLDDILYEFN